MGTALGRVSPSTGLCASQQRGCRGPHPQPDSPRGIGDLDRSGAGSWGCAEVACGRQGQLRAGLSLSGAPWSPDWPAPPPLPRGVQGWATWLGMARFLFSCVLRCWALEQKEEERERSICEYTDVLGARGLGSPHGASCPGGGQRQSAGAPGMQERPGEQLEVRGSPGLGPALTSTKPWILGCLRGSGKSHVPGREPAHRRPGRWPGIQATRLRSRPGLTAA